MKTRLIKNWITSLCGLFLFAFGCVLLYKQIVTWEAFIASLPTIFLLFRAKDSLLGAKAKE